MAYFLSNQNLEKNKAKEIFGEEASHILFSRRIKIGEIIAIQGVDGSRFECEVKSIQRKSLNVLPKKQLVVPNESNVPVSLFQSAISESAWDFILQKATELGADKIFLFPTQNSPKKITSDDFKKKFLRWEKILWESAKQCGRGRTPEMLFLKSLDEAVEKAKNLQTVFLCDEEGGPPPFKNHKLSAIGLFVGPEGGFTKQEVDQIKTIKNCHSLRLSNFTLRAETAAIAGVTILVNF